MEVKEAVQIAKDYVADIYSAEHITNLGLEEVEFDHISNKWKITVGFSRPWDHNNALHQVIREGRPERSYKLVRISDESRSIESVTDRFLVDSRLG